MIRPLPCSSPFPRPQAAALPSRRAAFTLVELLAVVAIISVITAITLPAVRSLARDNSRVQAAHQIRAILSHARATAIAQNRSVGVVFFEETAKYALPVHGGRTAVQLFAEDFEQRRPEYLGSTGSAPADKGNTVFIALNPARDYLPEGIKVAALNDDVSRGVMTGDEASASLGRTRAVLFDAQGRMLTRHGLARPDLAPANTPGAYPWAMGDWDFTTKLGNPSIGVSSPGIFLYDERELHARNIPADDTGDEARTAWIRNNASVILVNANTGALLP